MYPLEATRNPIHPALHTRWSSVERSSLSSALQRWSPTRIKTNYSERQDLQLAFKPSHADSYPTHWFDDNTLGDLQGCKHASDGRVLTHINLPTVAATWGTVSRQAHLLHTPPVTPGLGRLTVLVRCVFVLALWVMQGRWEVFSVFMPGRSPATTRLGRLIY